MFNINPFKKVETGQSAVSKMKVPEGYEPKKPEQSVDDVAFNNMNFEEQSGVIQNILEDESRSVDEALRRIQISKFSKDLKDKFNDAIQDKMAKQQKLAA